MHLQKILRQGIPYLLCATLWTACKDTRMPLLPDLEAHIPPAPDYTDSTLWYCVENDIQEKGADVFYLVSTWEEDWTTDDGRICHHADVYNQTHRERMSREISRVSEYMGEGNNFYAPFYRHTTIQAWLTLNEDTINRRFSLAFDDVQHAFHEFLKRRSPGRPFILAGFSQGAKAVVELLKAMPETLHKDLVAAYVLGYKVTPADTLASHNIKAAQDSTDLGVTICYNSVADEQFIKPIVSAPCAMCINPVNWHIDDTPAVLHDTITVTASPQHHVLVVKGYSGSEYQPIYDILNTGDFHSAEPWLYAECLRQNIKARIHTYYARKK